MRIPRGQKRRKRAAFLLSYGVSQIHDLKNASFPSISYWNQALLLDYNEADNL